MLGRFRVSAFFQRNSIGMVLRRIETIIPTLDSLYMPQVIKSLATTKRGLVIFVGDIGTGKSTTLAALIGHRNNNSTGHIISLEDPIEFVHQHAGCIITQREVSLDTGSFDVGLRNMLREAPDVILIGEVRTRETMDYAIAFAETGHLCLATLHANNASAKGGETEIGPKKREKAGKSWRLWIATDCRWRSARTRRTTMRSRCAGAAEFRVLHDRSEAGKPDWRSRLRQ